MCVALPGRDATRRGTALGCPISEAKPSSLRLLPQRHRYHAFRPAVSRRGAAPRYAQTSKRTHEHSGRLSFTPRAAPASGPGRPPWVPARGAGLRPPHGAISSCHLLHHGGATAVLTPRPRGHARTFLSGVAAGCGAGCGRPLQSLPVRVAAPAPHPGKCRAPPSPPPPRTTWPSQVRQARGTRPCCISSRRHLTLLAVGRTPSLPGARAWRGDGLGGPAGPRVMLALERRPLPCWPPHRREPPMTEARGPGSRAPRAVWFGLGGPPGPTRVPPPARPTRVRVQAACEGHVPFALGPGPRPHDSPPAICPGVRWEAVQEEARLHPSDILPSWPAPGPAVPRAAETPREGCGAWEPALALGWTLVGLEEIQVGGQKLKQFGGPLRKTTQNCECGMAGVPATPLSGWGALRLELHPDYAAWGLGVCLDVSMVSTGPLAWPQGSVRAADGGDGAVLGEGPLLRDGARGRPRKAAPL